MIPRQRFAASELSSARELVWLLTIQGAGAPYRIASRAVEVSSDAGALAYRGGLDVGAWEERIDDDPVSAREVALRLPAPTLASLASPQRPLDTLTGELSLWLPGDPYEQRLVMLTGALATPAYGADGEPFTVQLREEPADDTSLIPGATLVVSSDTWPGADDENQVYPVVWGAPGALSNGATFPATPALVVSRSGGNAQTLLIAGHHVESANVRIYDSAGAFDDLPVSNTTDGQGQAVAVVDVSGSTTLDLTGKSFYVAWNDGYSLPGVHGAGGLLYWLLMQSTLQVDHARVLAIRDALDAYQLSGFADQPASAWDLVQEVILAMVPVSLLPGPGGIYPVLRSWSRQTLIPRVHLEHGRNVARTGPIEYRRQVSDLVAQVQIRYARDRSAGDYLRALTHGHGGDVSSLHAEIAYLRHGQRTVSIRADDVCLDETAQRIAWDQVAASTAGGRVVTVESWQTDAGHLGVGDVVAYTDSTLTPALSARLATVIARRLMEVGIELELELDDDPARSVI